MILSRLNYASNVLAHLLYLVMFSFCLMLTGFFDVDCVILST